MSTNATDLREVTGGEQFDVEGGFVLKLFEIQNLLARYNQPEESKEVTLVHEPTNQRA